ncbi:choice-of-anchor J domain-containing protein, partial [Ignavibacterium sp.]|uniref:choice-of-anchor J domain-containing protein n=1 Tax=Ignavibacterium sp. TaxID=2651167 RepID=UPI00307EE15F
LDDITIEEIPAAPLFSISPASKDFGTVIAGNSVSATFTISNTGAGTLTINNGGITLTGANADQFTLGSITYPINLNNGESTQITVNFAPTSAGSKSANLQIVHNAPGSPAVVPLTGNALPAGILFEDFTDENALARWTVVNRDGGAVTWFRSTAKFNSSPASAASRWESSTLQNDDWLISPKLVVASGDSISFWHSIQSSVFPESLYVMVGTTNNPDTGVWDTLAVIFDNTTTWKQKKYSLNAYAGQQIYVAFVNRSLDAFYLYIDDIIGPQVYVPAIDLALTDFYQSTGLPVPRGGEKFTDYRISQNSENVSDSKPLGKLSTNLQGLRSTNSNNTVVIEGNNFPNYELNNVQLKAAVENLGTNAASYNLN